MSGKGDLDGDDTPEGFSPLSSPISQVRDNDLNESVKDCYPVARLIVNIVKGTTDPRVEFISQVITQILIKQFQNFD